MVRRTKEKVWLWLVASLLIYTGCGQAPENIYHRDCTQQKDAIINQYGYPQTGLLDSNHWEYSAPQNSAKLISKVDFSVPDCTVTITP